MNESNYGNYTLLCYVMLYYVILCYIMLYFVILCYFMLYYVMLYAEPNIALWTVNCIYITLC